jgi:hypothetical protein
MGKRSFDREVGNPAAVHYNRRRGLLLRTAAWHDGLHSGLSGKAAMLSIVMPARRTRASQAHEPDGAMAVLAGSVGRTAGR